MTLTALSNRLRQSIVRDAYLWVCKRSELKRRDAEVAFYRQFIPPGSLVFDIGANHGQKTDVFLRAGAGRVVAVEPDPASIQTLHQKFIQSRWKPLPVKPLECVVSDGFGITTLNRPAPGSALCSVEQMETPHDGVECYKTTLDRLIQLYSIPAFIKIDVEGHELEVLRGLSQAVPLSFEVNLPEHREKGLACIRRLEELSPGGQFNFVYNETPHLVYAEWLGGFVAWATLANWLPRECSVEVFWRPAQ